MLVEILGQSYYVDKYDNLWDHTMMRITNAKKSSSDEKQFAKKMITRLNKITNKQKVIYAIAALRELGYYDLVEIHESVMLMDLIAGVDFLK